MLLKYGLRNNWTRSAIICSSPRNRKLNCAEDKIYPHTRVLPTYHIYLHIDKLEPLLLYVFVRGDKETALDSRFGWPCVDTELSSSHPPSRPPSSVCRAVCPKAEQQPSNHLAVIKQKTLSEYCDRVQLHQSR